MLSEKQRCFKQHPAVSLETLVPADNFYWQLEARVDLSFVRELVQDYYAPVMGRPSIDPVVFFKLQLIMFFEGIRSERQLMETVNLHLAHRWYLGYDLDEAVPDHSSLSKIRTRYGLDIFQRFFEQIVELCQQAGLIWGKELYFDGTKVEANAAMNSLVPRWYWRAQQHLSTLFDAPAVSDAMLTGRGFVDKYNGTRLTGRRQQTYERIADNQVSSTDADASLMSRFTGDRARLGYHTHYVVDGGKAHIILGALVTPASIMDNTPMLDLARWVRFRWQLQPRIAVADTKYGTTPNLVGLEQDGLGAYIPSPEPHQQGAFYALDRFTYIREGDYFLCPEGRELHRVHIRPDEQMVLYRGKAKICNACPVKSACTNSRSGRNVSRSLVQDLLDRIKAYHITEAYQKAMRKRQVWVEPLFGEGKQWHGMRRFRLRRLWRVNIEGLIRAAGQNIKRLLKHSSRNPRLSPAGGAGRALFSFAHDLTGSR